MYRNLYLQQNIKNKLPKCRIVKLLWRSKAHVRRFKIQRALKCQTKYCIKCIFGRQEADQTRSVWSIKMCYVWNFSNKSLDIGDMYKFIVILEVLIHTFLCTQHNIFILTNIQVYLILLTNIFMKREQPKTNRPKNID